MDLWTRFEFPHPLVITGMGSIVRSPLNNSSFPSIEENLPILPRLKVRKMRKLMGKQDQLAVIAAGDAVTQAKVPEELFLKRTGIFLTVGYIPFEQREIETLAEHSTENGQFSMKLFATKGNEKINPLQTFRCLPNMPIFHVSFNLGITGPYFISYPGAGQFYQCLEQAAHALFQGEIDIALVGAVADQNNFLTQHHFQRLPSMKKLTLADAASFWVLEKKDFALERKISPLLEWREYQSGYQSPDPFQWTEKSQGKEHFQESLSSFPPPLEFLGPASFGVHLKMAFEKSPQVIYQHQLMTMDGIYAKSSWSP